MDNQTLRKYLYHSGDAFLPDSVRNTLVKNIVGSSKNTFYISGWSLVHLMNGLLFGYLYLHFRYNVRYYTATMLIIHTLWELWQVFIGMSKPYMLTGPSNIVDTFIDTILFMFGTSIIRKILR
jgi:hypothetical protein